jgi:Uma2 family endonuclease
MSSAARGHPGQATLADLLAIPEERRCHELLGGELIEKEAASGRHGQAQGSLFHLLFPYRRRSAPPDRPGGWLFATEVEVYFDAENTLRPDNVGWRRERLPELPGAAPIRIVPDWISEILSTNKRNDLIRKKRVYHHHRVSHYWIIDPAEEMLLVHRWTPDGYVEVLAAERRERVRAEPFDAIEIPVGVLFGDDEE